MFYLNLTPNYLPHLDTHHTDCHNGDQSVVLGHTGSVRSKAATEQRLRVAGPDSARARGCGGANNNGTDNDGRDDDSNNADSGGPV